MSEPNKGTDEPNRYGPVTQACMDEVLDTLDCGLLFFDREGIIRRSNAQAVKDLRIDPTGQKLAEVIVLVHCNQDVLPALLGQMDEPHTRQVQLPEDTFIHATRTGARFFATGRIVRLEHGDSLFEFRNVVEDMTKQYLLKMALSSTRIFPWFYDPQRATMVIDERYYEYTGISTTDNTMTLEEFNERLHPDDRQPMTEAFAKQLGGNHYPYPVPFRLRRGDGQYEWFEGQSTYLGLVGQFPYRVVGICMSTQTHKDVEEALIAARNRAEQSDRLKSTFLANMSHEIRTPLNAIVGFSSLLTNGEIDTDGDDAREYAELINKNCNHLLTIISDIIDLSRIEADALEYRFCRQSLRQLLTEAYDKHRTWMPAGVDFRLEVDGDDPNITTDPLRLRQVIDNLLSNAAKFTNSGRIVLGCQTAHGRDTVDIYVEDTGRGIPREEFGRIFERFHKVDSFVQGAGLGLPICRTITERLGGTIEVASEVGKGSRFTLRLPLAGPGK